MIRKMISLFLLAVAIAAAAGPTKDAHASVTCTDASDSVYPTQTALGFAGLYSVPSATPTQLVVFDHGYRKPATAYWTGHLLEAASHGAVAVGPDYTGIGPAPDYRGWNVRAGATDSIAAAQFFLNACPTIQKVFILGVSMGGNASGLAVAAGAKRSNGAPLFDYWVDVEGATNVTETYLEASAVAPSGNAYAAGAKEDIESEMGGPLAGGAAGQYWLETVVSHGPDFATSGVKGVIIVHGVGDGLVPYNQSREMEAALIDNGVPTDFYTVGTRGDGEAGTTADGYIPVAHDSPFAGHGAEESTTQLVIKTGFERLWALMAGTTTVGPHRQFVVDGNTGLSVGGP